MGRGEGSGSKEQHVRRLRGKSCWEFSPARVSELVLNLPQVRGHSIIWVPAEESLPARGIVSCGSAPPLHVLPFPKLPNVPAPASVAGGFSKKFPFSYQTNQKRIGTVGLLSPSSPQTPNNTRNAKDKSNWN